MLYWFRRSQASTFEDRRPIQLPLRPALRKSVCRCQSIAPGEKKGAAGSLARAPESLRRPDYAGRSEAGVRPRTCAVHGRIDIFRPCFSVLPAKIKKSSKSAITIPERTTPSGSLASRVRRTCTNSLQTCELSGQAWDTPAPRQLSVRGGWCRGSRRTYVHDHDWSISSTVDSAAASRIEETHCGAADNYIQQLRPKQSPLHHAWPRRIFGLISMIEFEPDWMAKIVVLLLGLSNKKTQALLEERASIISRFLLAGCRCGRRLNEPEAKKNQNA